MKDMGFLLRYRAGFFTLSVIIILFLSTVFLFAGSSSGAGEAPEAVFNMEKNYFNTGEEIFFNATDCSDPEGEDLLYLWDFGEGEPENIVECFNYHTYNTPGRYTIKLTVSDPQKQTDSFSGEVFISDPQPVVAITSPLNGDHVSINAPVIFEAVPHYIVDKLVLYEWDFDEDGITDVFSPDRRIERTFTSVTTNMVVACNLTYFNDETNQRMNLSKGSTKITIHVSKIEEGFSFLSPLLNSTFDVKEKINFSAEWHNQTGDNIFYEWDFDDDGVIDKITIVNYTTHSYRKEYDEDTTITARVSISNTTDVYFEPAEVKITINKYVNFGETLSDMAVIVILAICGCIIVVGFVGSWALKKFGLPEVLSLVALGVILVPIGSLMDPEPMFRISTVFGSLALMIILFDGGLDLNLQKVRDETSRALLLALVGFIITIFSIGFFTGWLFFDNKWSVGILFGAVIGGTSGSIVLPLISKLDVSESTKTLVGIESTLTDVFCIVVVIAIANYISPVNGAIETSAGVKMAVSAFISAFAIGIVTGLFLGLLWINVLKRIKGFQYSFMLTIAIVFILYAFNQYVGGSGPVSVLIFGLILANGKEIGSMLRIRNVSEISKPMKDFHSQLSFIIRTFFFVFLGIIVSKELFSLESWKVWATGAALLVIIFIARWLAVNMVIRRGEAKKDRDLLSLLLPRGLAAAVLALVPVTYHFLDNNILDADQIRLFFDSAFVVIIFTVMFTTIGVPLCQRSRRKREALSNIVETTPEKKRIGPPKRKEPVPEKARSKGKGQKGTASSPSKDGPKARSGKEKPSSISAPEGGSKPRSGKGRSKKSGGARGGPGGPGVGPGVPGVGPKAGPERGERTSEGRERKERQGNRSRGKGSRSKGSSSTSSRGGRSDPSGNRKKSEAAARSPLPPEDKPRAREPGEKRTRDKKPEKKTYATKILDSIIEREYDDPHHSGDGVSPPPPDDDIDDPYSKMLDILGDDEPAGRGRTGGSHGESDIDYRF